MPKRADTGIKILPCISTVTDTGGDEDVIRDLEKEVPPNFLQLMLFHRILDMHNLCLTLFNTRLKKVNSVSRLFFNSICAPHLFSTLELIR